MRHYDVIILPEFADLIWLAKRKPDTVRFCASHKFNEIALADGYGHCHATIASVMRNEFKIRVDDCGILFRENHNWFYDDSGGWLGDARKIPISHALSALPKELSCLIKDFLQAYDDNN